MKVQRLALVVAATVVWASPAKAEELRATEARQFIAGKHFSYSCFDGTNGNGRIYADGSVVRVPAAWRVEGVQTTGAGDMFTACYAMNRSAGVGSERAVELASELVARELENRLRTAAIGRA